MTRKYFQIVHSQNIRNNSYRHQSTFIATWFSLYCIFIYTFQKELPASTTYPTSNRLVELLFIKVIKLSSTTAELFNLLPKISPNSS
nr:uncharacterized protein LOC106623841 isoform X3 [Bactrocera oleae]